MPPAPPERARIRKRRRFERSRAGIRSKDLAEALAEGLFVGHPDMPQFVFDAQDVGAIIAYLKSIQER